jgi:hypothetical protein
MPAASYVRIDGSAELTPADLMTALNALSDAAEYRANNPGPSDYSMMAAYRSLSFRLGDDR